MCPNSPIYDLSYHILITVGVRSIARCYYIACRDNHLPTASAARRRPGRRMTAYPAARRTLFMNPIQIAPAGRQAPARTPVMQMHLHICGAAGHAAIGATVADEAVI